MTSNSSQPTPERTSSAARAFDASSGPLTFLKHLPSEDVYIRGTPPNRALIAIPGLWTSMSDDLLGDRKSVV